MVGWFGTFPATQSFHMAMITDLQCYLVCGFVHGFALHRALCQFFGACGALARCLRHATTVEGFGEGRAKMDVKYLHIRAAVRAGDGEHLRLAGERGGIKRGPEN